MVILLGIAGLVWGLAAPLWGADLAAPPVNFSEPYESPTNGLGSWIWTKTNFNGQTCQFWRKFEIPPGAKVVKARLAMTADDEFTLFLDGRELGRGVDWRELYDFNFLAPLLTPGSHILTVRAFNSVHFAGLICGLRIELADGRHLALKSDETWYVVPDGVKNLNKIREAPLDWQPAVVEAPFGGAPWIPFPVNIDKMPALQPVKIYFWQTGWFQITLLCVCGLVILFSLRLMAQLALHQKERWLLQQERSRIAREIHDDIGARMTQLVLLGEVAQSGLPSGSEMSQHLVHICEEARGLLSTMDEILWAVNPRRDTLRDFTAYVCNYTQTFLKPTSIQPLFEVDAEMEAATLDLPVRRSLLMAIKEALNNAVKYSAATELRLQISRHGQRLIVVVQDNGQGFDPVNPKSERNGLTNMLHRMKELGGHCHIHSQPGHGCRVEFNLPVRVMRVLKPPEQYNRWGWF
ncbi:MAG TPA: ATP-binding protein [Dongiaceae bacterium]|jgi:signal transduction histidine kinase|nr:ATP-binding protein [Dongiaceae bacterium]